MCGIAGYIAPDTKNREKIIHDMTEAIFHRGPDDSGFFVDDTVGLGMRRLSIIDLARGKQPISSQDGNLMIFFNGEIYNYKELKEELLARGKVFKTDSDTEVILQMYETFGPKMLSKLRGMFTFAIYDQENKTLFLARDFFGIKPLYYWKKKNNIIAFSSEIKSFLRIAGFKREVNDSAVFNYLSFQYNPLTETFFKGVHKLPPGHYLAIDLKSCEFHIEKYWEFSLSPDDNLGEKETKKKILETMKDSVAHHMIADVPVGSFLSGGIDSSIIATLMQEVRGERKIKTFTVGFDTTSEGKEANDTSDYLGTDHKEIKVGADTYWKTLPKAVFHFDEPVADPSAIGIYFLSEAARREVKVVLSGEGSDELFGGYNIYLEPFARKKIAWIPQTILNSIAKHPGSFRGKAYAERATRRLEEWYIGNASIFKPAEVKKLWKATPGKTYSLHPLYEKVSHLSDSTKMQYIDVHTWLVGDILAKADKMTMAHSLELRVPFLDIKVSDLAAKLPDKFKWTNGVTKYLLREAFKKVIPEKARKRKKLGFPTPIAGWLNKDRKDLYLTILKNPYIMEKMDTRYIEKLISDHLERKADNARKIYLLLVLALWYNIFISKSRD